MASTIHVEFKIKLDNDICQSSRWKTKEKFFKALVINYLDEDLIFVKNYQKSAPPEEKEGFNGLITTLKNLKNDVNQSISYTTLNTKDNIEEIQINFTFNHYENDFYNAKRFVKHYVFNETVNSCKSMIDMINFMTEIAPKKKELDIKMYKHLSTMLKEAKKTLTFPSNSNEITTKNKMV